MRPCGSLLQRAEASSSLRGDPREKDDWIFFPGDAREKIVLRRKMLREYQFFKSGTGRYQAVFKMEENGSDSEEDDFPMLSNTIKTVDISTISSWLSSTDGHMSRLAWFETCAPNSIFYLKVAKPLLSLRSSGSMIVERVAKPLKNSVFNKFRRRLTRQRASKLLRCGLNLRFLVETKMAMKSMQN